MRNTKVLVLGGRQTLGKALVDKISNTGEFTIIDVETEAFLVDRFPVPNVGATNAVIRKPKSENSYDWFRKLNPSKKRW